MKTTPIQINYDESKLNAICLYLSNKDTDLDEELSGFMDSIYKKYVPSQVREYIEKTSDQLFVDQSKNIRRSVRTRNAICGDDVKGRTDTCNSEEFAAKDV